MKKILVLFFLIPILFLSSCRKDNPAGPEESGRQGQITLNFDKTNAPLDIVKVVATLTRSGYTTITGSLNIQSDSSASLSLSSIPVGGWLLKVEAKNDSGEVKYAGEANVTIVENTTIAVNLVLNPVGSTGCGSISIKVYWGVLKTWTDNPNNPVFKVSPTNPQFISSPRVIYDETKFRMWYRNNYSNESSDVGYAESSDGINWQSASSTAVLTPGASGSFDCLSVEPGAVIKDNGIFKMYYTGLVNMLLSSNIGMALSTDGIHWEKRSNPILNSPGGDIQIFASSVVKRNNVYYLFYTNPGSLPNSGGIEVATSTDGVVWKKFSSNPVMKASQAWEASGIGSPSVILENGKFKMVYSTFDGSGFGMAYSDDGINWTKDSGNPFFTAQDTYKGWASKISSPHFMKVNNQYYIYYSGSSSSDKVMAIGLATKN